MRWTLDQKKHHVAAWSAGGLTREQYCELTTFRLNPCASGRRMLNKVKNEPEDLKLFPFQYLAVPVWLMADHCRMGLSHISFPEVSGCAASPLS